jgi:uncharacterized Ntn-hydrolase superfamily protein
MKKSNAQRQRNYRDRHLKQTGEEHEMLERINQMISLSAKDSLKNLASYYGVTQRTILERAIKETQNKLLNTMPNEQQNDYYDMKITLRSNNNEEPSINEKLTR